MNLDEKILYLRLWYEFELSWYASCMNLTLPGTRNSS